MTRQDDPKMIRWRLHLKSPREEVHRHLATAEGRARFRAKSAADRQQNLAGWVTVLLALKAAVDFGVDLRNRESRRSWDQGSVDVQGTRTGAPLGSRPNREEP